MTSVTIIGSNSFIGRNLHNYLSVRGFNVNIVSSRIDQLLVLPQNPSFFVSDVLILVGWPMGVDIPDSHFFYWAQTLCSLFDIFLGTSKTKRLIVLGSCLEAGCFDQILISESTSFVGLSLYGLRKVHFYRLLSSYSFFDHQVAWARIFAPTGLFENENRLFPNLTYNSVASRPLSLSFPSTLRDFYTVDYLSEYIFRIIDSKFYGLINVGTGLASTIHSIAETVKYVNHSSSSIEVDLTSVVANQPYKSASRIADASFLRRELGFIKPKSIYSIACLHRSICLDS
jgi:nucleoside-diphosphate-sugar epimerase